MEELKRDVMLSVSGKYTEPILRGVKWWEVRKTAPKIKPPFTVYLYETRSPYTSFGFSHRGAGCVIGEFVCDRIAILPRGRIGFLVPRGTCLSSSQVQDYAGDADKLYLWHISKVKKYVMERPLYFYSPPYSPGDFRVLTRPPQSWCYVMPLEGTI